MRQYLDLLARTALFTGLTQAEIGAMLDRLPASVRCYPKGAPVFHSGDRVTAVALLLEGCVHIQKEDHWGNLSILSEIVPGEIFGEVYACLGGAPILHHAVAAAPSRVLFLDVDRLLSADPSAGPFHSRLIRNLLSVLAAKNQLLAQKLAHISQRTTRGKLLSYLSEQSQKAGSPSFHIPFNRQQLADFLSVDRSAMSHELCKMRDEGILSFDKNHFVLK